MDTVTSSVITETEVRNSRFIAELLPYDRLVSRLAELRIQHRKASHHVMAYRYFNAQRQLIEHGKDDGEVSGTAGGPALRVLQGHDLVECGLIIVRYFGGVKLGTGGLIRAYGDAAGAVVKTSKVVPYSRTVSAELVSGFHHASELERLCARFQVNVLDRDYTETGMTLVISGAESDVSVIRSEWEQFTFRQAK